MIMKIVKSKEQDSKIEGTIKIDKKLDKIKNVKFVSNKTEEINKYVSTLKLSF